MPVLQMRARRLIFLVVILLLFAVLLGWPLVQVLGVAFLGIPAPGHPSAFTSTYLLAVFRDPNLRQGLLNSTAIAVCVTMLCGLVSVPLAMLSVRFDFSGKRLMSGLLLVPLILPPFVGAIGMRQILGRFGVLTAIAQDIGLVSRDHPIEWFGGSARLAGVILIEALALYPILYLNVTAALANLDPALERAAANLGASRWTVFRRITLPL